MAEIKADYTLSLKHDEIKAIWASMGRMTGEQVETAKISNDAFDAVYGLLDDLLGTDD